jgi:glycosyltransferase involved in cell wall biosynthesis
MKISIAIPTYECHGLGWLFISELLNSIKKQDYSNYEVVISDQSTDDKTKKLVGVYAEMMNIVYLDSKHLDRKIGPNINNAIKHCTGDLIKTMCADDFFIDDSALTKIVKEFYVNEDKQWLLSGCGHAKSIHMLYDRLIPYYQDKIHHGANTISSPSVLTMRNKEYFDENLALLIDCEMYKRLYIKHGTPIIIQDPLIANRVHDNQMQNKDSGLLESEKQYCINLYGE